MTRRSFLRRSVEREPLVWGRKSADERRGNKILFSQQHSSLYSRRRTGCAFAVEIFAITMFGIMLFNFGSCRGEVPKAQKLLSNTIIQ